MRIELLAVDRLRTPWARAGVEEYLGRVARYAPAARREVKAARGDSASAAEEEGERLLKAAAVSAGDRLIALDPGGESLDSPGWATLLSESADAGVGRLVFVVGGAGGLAPAVRAAADRVLGFGPQTLPHELAQVVLAEQLYRAWTLIRREPYHK